MTTTNEPRATYTPISGRFERIPGYTVIGHREDGTIAVLPAVCIVDNFDDSREYETPEGTFIDNVTGDHCPPGFVGFDID